LKALDEAVIMDSNMTTAPDVTDEPVVEKPDGLHYEALEVPGAASEVVYTDTEMKQLVHRLDLWILPVLMISYGLQ
jgi:hypothetical protein